MEGLPQPVGVAIAQGLAGALRRAGKQDQAVRLYREVAEVLGDLDKQNDATKKGIEILNKLAEQLET